MPDTAEKNLAAGGCPEFETLSAGFDGFISFTEEQLQHIHSCRFCQEKLFYLKRLNEASHTLVSKNMPDHLSEKVCHRIHDALGKKAWFFSRAWQIRTVLFFLIAGAFLWLFVREQGNKEEVISTGPSAPRHISEMLQSNTSFAIPARKVVTYRSPDAVSSSIDPWEMSFCSKCFCVMDGQGRFYPTEPGIIPLRIRQIWTSRTCGQNALKSNLESLCSSLRIRKYELKSSDGVMTFQADLKARQAAVLAKQLSAWGLTTISHRAPQGRMTVYYGDGNADVKLYLSMLMPSKEPTLELLSGDAHLVHSGRHVF